MGRPVIAKRQRISGEQVTDVWVFWCPGCECCHSFDERWSVTGPADNPTAHPSLKTGHEISGKMVWNCHLFVRNGELQFLGDCKHDLAGKTVPMVPVDRFGFRAQESD